MIEADLVDFGNTDLPHRLLHGGLPSFFLSPEPPERDFQEWMDAYWARDSQELFRLERRASFQRFIELLMAQSGGLFEATRFAAPCDLQDQWDQLLIVTMTDETSWDSAARGSG